MVYLLIGTVQCSASALVGNVVYRRIELFCLLSLWFLPGPMGGSMNGHNDKPVNEDGSINTEDSGEKEKVHMRIPTELVGYVTV